MQGVPRVDLSVTSAVRGSSALDSRIASRVREVEGRGLALVHPFQRIMLRLPVLSRCVERAFDMWASRRACRQVPSSLRPP